MKKIINISLAMLGTSISINAASAMDIKELYNNVEIAWPSPTPWINDRFNQFVTYLPKNAIVAEIGVQEGSFSTFIVRHTNPKKLYLIDCWEYQDPNVLDDPEANVEQKKQDKFYHDVKSKFASNPNIVVIKEYSKNAAAEFPDEFFDWIYIDSNHAYWAIKEDLALWWPKIKRGGFICGHDYIAFERHGFGVTRAVNEFLRDNNLYFAYLTSGDVHESWAIRKP